MIFSQTISIYRHKILFQISKIYFFARKIHADKIRTLRFIVMPKHQIILQNYIILHKLTSSMFPKFYFCDS